MGAQGWVWGVPVQDWLCSCRIVSGLTQVEEEVGAGTTMGT